MKTKSKHSRNIYLEENNTAAPTGIIVLLPCIIMAFFIITLVIEHIKQYFINVSSKPLYFFFVCVSVDIPLLF